MSVFLTFTKAKYFAITVLVMSFVAIGYASDSVKTNVVVSEYFKEHCYTILK